MKNNMWISASVFLLLGLFIQYSSSTVSTSPVLCWSNTNAFEGKNKENPELTSVDKLPFSQLNSNELFILYAIPELPTERFTLLTKSNELQHLKEIFSSKSSSSVAFPYSTAVSESITSDIIANVMKSLSVDPSVYIVGDIQVPIEENRVKRISSENIKSAIKSALKNGRTDILIVSMDSASSLDSVIEEMDAALQGVNYMAVFTGNSAGISSSSLPRDVPATHPMIKRFAQQQRQDQLGADEVLFPPHVIEGLVVMVPFLIILAIGITCLFNLQSGLKFEAERAVKKTQ